MASATPSSAVQSLRAVTLFSHAGWDPKLLAAAESLMADQLMADHIHEYG